MSSTSMPYAARAGALPRAGRLPRLIERLMTHPELPPLLGLTALLNLWGLAANGWANTYYAAAVRSMASSWHDFLFASLDHSGLMTVDKPPLSLWVQALSVRIFGWHPLSVLIPQALMGVVAVGLLYDLVRRRFGRLAGFVAGLALATTPVIVAVSRHNNPDELLVLCCLAALWFAARALDTRRTLWLVLSGVSVGLAFETKMLVALVVVPGIALGWLWGTRGRAWLRSVRQLVAGGVAMVLVGGAWPLLVTLTPAADRPWISGTSDNSIWSLIFGYNGLGRISGQTGGPQAFGGGGTLFGGPTGPFRMLQNGLGDQAGWLLGLAVVAGLGLLVSTRLSRRDPRTGWLIVVGGSFACTAAVLSFASGIFHPYYVSLLAPFAAALLGAGVAQMLGGDRFARVFAPLAIAAGVTTELVVLNEVNGALSWAAPVVAAVGGACAVALVVAASRRVRLALVCVALAALLAAPATWAIETLGHATNGTFPTGGPAIAATDRPGGLGGGVPRMPFGAAAPRGGGVAPPGGGFAPPGAAGGFAPPGAAGGFAPPGAAGGFAPPGAAGGFAPPGASGGFAAPGAGADSSTLTVAVRYAQAHGGGTIGVSSQGTAASLILSTHANVAGIGGFSGRESSVTPAWIATEVSAGKLRWIVADSGRGMGAPGDTRTGSQSAMNVVARACRAVTVTGSGSGTAVTGSGSGTAVTGSSATVTMYDCLGRSAAILQVVGQARTAG